MTEGILPVLSSTMGFPGSSAGKESSFNAGDLGSIHGLRRSPGEEKVYPLQYPSLENSMDCIVHGVIKRRTWLSDFHFTSVLQSVAWKTVDFPGGSAGKESACNVGHLGLIPGLGRLSGEMNGCPFQYSSLENSMDCIVHGVAKSWTWLSDFHFHFGKP